MLYYLECLDCFNTTAKTTPSIFATKTNISLSSGPYHPVTPQLQGLYM